MWFILVGRYEDLEEINNELPYNAHLGHLKMSRELVGSNYSKQVSCFGKEVRDALTLSQLYGKVISLLFIRRESEWLCHKPVWRRNGDLEIHIFPKDSCNYCNGKEN